MHQGWSAGQAVEATWPPNLPPKKVDFGNFEPKNPSTKFQPSNIIFTVFNTAITFLKRGSRRFFNFALVRELQAAKVDLRGDNFGFS